MKQTIIRGQSRVGDMGLDPAAGSSRKRGKQGVGSELRWHHPQTLAGQLLWQRRVFTSAGARRDVLI